MSKTNQSSAISDMHLDVGPINACKYAIHLFTETRNTSYVLRNICFKLFYNKVSPNYRLISQYENTTLYGYSFKL